MRRFFCLYFICVKTETAEMHKEEASVSQASRAKMTLLKKRLEEKDRIISEKDEVIKTREQQVEAKERVLAERDSFINSLNEQLEEKTKILENLQAGRSFACGDGDSEVSGVFFSFTCMNLCTCAHIHIHFFLC